jgi:Protein of unknown function (DUF1302)
MVRKNCTSIMKAGGFLLGCGGLMLASSSVLAAPGYGDEPTYTFGYSGYIRETIGVSLEDYDETSADDKWRMTQAKTTLQLDFDIKTGPLLWKVVTRFDKEIQTDYLDDLEERSNYTSAFFDIEGNYGKNGIKGDYMEQYDTTDEVMDWLREVYFDVNLFDDRLFVRVGRQQLVWGESDFFQAMDVVHGYDYRGRLFYENNEEWRKPLMLFNFQLAFDDLGGTLNWFIRPGWDRAEDMGSNYNIEGGRWIPHPYRGVDFTSFTNSYRTDHDSGDWSDTTYGIRWNGTWGSIGYSFAYMKTFNAAPIVNPRSAGTGEGLYGGTNSDNAYSFWGVDGPSESYGGDEPDGGKSCRSDSFLGEGGFGFGCGGGSILGDWMYPEIDVYGFTINGFNQAMDATLSAEIAYIPNKPYNYGSLDSDLPGWNGVKEKDTINVMLRIDKEFKWMETLGTHRPSLSSVQLFDTWILAHDDDDELVEFASFGAPKKEHQAYLTIFTLLNFNRDTINPSFVAGTDLSRGGGFAIPAVEFVMGDSWRFKVEADLWWNDGDKKKVCGSGTTGDSSCDTGIGEQNLGKRENSSGFMDWFADDNQLVFKLTRQF